MTKRIDVHRPSAIDTNDYQYVGIEYMKLEDIGACHILIEERKRFDAHRERTGGNWSTHQHGGNCHVCGAHCIYTFIFHHIPTNTYIRTGSTCVDKMDVECGDAFRTLKLVKKGVKDARYLIAGKAKAEALLSDAGCPDAWTLYLESPHFNQTVAEPGFGNPDFSMIEARGLYTESGGVEWCYDTLRDIVGKLVKHGSVSEKQMTFVSSLTDQCLNFKQVQADREAKRTAERAAGTDVPETDERITIEGEIVSIKYNDLYEYYQMLVKDDRGFKVWGTKPKAVDIDGKGSRVTFDAKVTRSDKDSQFGFFKRPTKVTVEDLVAA